MKIVLTNEKSQYKKNKLRYTDTISDNYAYLFNSMQYL